MSQILPLAGNINVSDIIIQIYSSFKDFLRMLNSTRGSFKHRHICYNSTEQLIEVNDMYLLPDKNGHTEEAFSLDSEGATPFDYSGGLTCIMTELQCRHLCGCWECVTLL